MCAKKRHKTGSDFLHYLKDDLSNSERYDLERGLESDPFEKEAMEGLESLSPEKAEEDLLSLHVTMRKRLNRRKRVRWYSIAASVASILIVGTIFLNIYDLNPDDSDRAPLTEETFHTLDAESDVESDAERVAEPGPEPVSEQKPEPESITIPETEPEPVSAPAMVSAPVPTREKEVSPGEVEDLVVMEYAATEETEVAPREKSGAAKRSSQAIRTKNRAENQLAGKVSGIVVSSEDMDPVPGASIVISGTDSGTVADEEGRFTLPADDSQTTVVASFIGMETEEYQLDSESENQLVMQPDAATLDEIVVVDQGSKKEKKQRSQSPAEPAGGFKAFKKYMDQNMIFPGEYIPGERQVVLLQFTLLSTGSITDFQTLKTPGEPYTLEAKRLIMEGPEWTPASTPGGPVDEEVRIRIVFKK